MSGSMVGIYHRDTVILDHNGIKIKKNFINSLLGNYITVINKTNQNIRIEIKYHEWNGQKKHIVNFTIKPSPKRCFSYKPRYIYIANRAFVSLKIIKN